jgi:hypothetical protein
VHAAVYEKGTNYVPRDGFAYLHQGEAVVPEVHNRSREFSGYSGPGAAGSAVNVLVNAQVFVGDREITDIARVQASAVLVGALDTITNRGRNNP